MDTEPTITLHYVRKDGKRERTKFAHHTLSEARELAQWVLNVGERFLHGSRYLQPRRNNREDSESAVPVEVGAT